jgi:perosamine synthetase
MKVPQMLPWVGDEEYQALRSCFEEAWITEGPKSDEFLRRLLALTGSRYGVFAPNGTLALYLALKAVGVGPGDEVLVPDTTFVASANAVEMVGATPVFVEVKRGCFHIDIASCERFCGPRTRAVMPVHLWGTAVEMDDVMAFAKQRDLVVVEDAAQALDVRYRGKHAGSFGQASAFSFFADKTITTAEGGMVVTDDEQTYRRLLFLRNQGRLNRGSFVHPEVGYNFRITDMQAAVGLAQLGKLDEIKRRKARILEWYKNGLDGLPQVEFFRPPLRAEWIPFRMPLLCENAFDLMDHLKRHEVEPRSWFFPLHAQPGFVHLTHKQLSGAVPEDIFANAIYAYDHGVCLPTFPQLSKAQVDHVCKTIRAYYDAA